MKQETYLEFMGWLADEISGAKEDTIENKGFPNSYGAGYDLGLLHGLQSVWKYLEGDENSA